MGELLNADNWFAAIEPEHGAGNGHVGDLSYASVIAWERVDTDSGASLRAWIAGTPPLASDEFYDRVHGWILNHYIRLSSADVEERKARHVWREWNWS